MKANEKILRYFLISIAIGVAVFVFFHAQSLNVENFDSSSMNWAVWLIISLAIVPVTLYGIFLVVYANMAYS